MFRKTLLSIGCVAIACGLGVGEEQTSPEPRKQILITNLGDDLPIINPIKSKVKKRELSVEESQLEILREFLEKRQVKTSEEEEFLTEMFRTNVEPEDFSWGYFETDKSFAGIRLGRLLKPNRRQIEDGNDDWKLIHTASVTIDLRPDNGTAYFISAGQKLKQDKRAKSDPLEGWTQVSSHTPALFGYYFFAGKWGEEIKMTQKLNIQKGTVVVISR